MLIHRATDQTKPIQMPNLIQSDVLPTITTKRATPAIFPIVKMSAAIAHPDQLHSTEFEYFNG